MYFTVELFSNIRLYAWLALRLLVYTILCVGVWRLEYDSPMVIISMGVSTGALEMEYLASRCRC